MRTPQNTLLWFNQGPILSDKHAHVAVILQDP